MKPDSQGYQPVRVGPATPKPPTGGSGVANPVREAEQKASAERRALDASRAHQRLRVTLAAQFLSPTIDLNAYLGSGSANRGDAEEKIENALIWADMLIDSAGGVT